VPSCPCPKYYLNFLRSYVFRSTIVPPSRIFLQYTSSPLNVGQGEITGYAG
jgi:hypothetical protein